MKVLVSTSKGQGYADNDFHWTLDGELVYVGFISCGSPAYCGCDRSFSGFDTMKGTTTAIVEERSLTPESFIAEFAEAMTRAGWSFVDPQEQGRELLDIAARYDVGTVLQRLEDCVSIRVRA